MDKNQNDTSTPPKLYRRDLDRSIRVAVRLDPQSVIALSGLIEAYELILGRRASHTLLFRRFLQVTNDHLGDIIKLPPEQREAALAAERESVLRVART